MHKLFDKFFIVARVLPAVTIVSPIIIIALYMGILNNNWKETSVGGAIASVIIIYLAHISAELGKTYEERMYKKLKAKPTTIILRFSDNTINEISKIRYHKWLNKKIDDISLPLSLEEEINDNKSDAKYEDAINYLRVYSNAHREQTFRVYQELKKYNYWRNLYGSKYYALILYIIIIIREIIIIKSFKLNEIIVNPLPKYGVLIGITIWCITFFITVSEKNVKRNAFNYARTLIEVIDTIDCKD